ncbi:MAG: ribose-phosphate pyrophosphokinase [Candidatus Manganitrophus sp.]|nr:ribose-phosphate pyrophosphokinase [Candidatus Manganitrophus sp.]
MKKPLLLPFPGNAGLADTLAGRIDAEIGKLVVRRFPDYESYVRIESRVEGRTVLLCCTLDRPDEKIIPLLFLAKTARELGAEKVGLVAPYLAYMRQDARFQPGEGISSYYFGRLLSDVFDGLVTVDPHLHRHRSLEAVYSIPNRVVHAAPAISDWIRAHFPHPLLIGPDRESEQWVSAVAGGAGAPHLILEKIRRSDREVEISLPAADRWHDRTPVLIDDIISSAGTMIEAVGQVRRAGLPPPVCIGVHAVFADRAYADLLASGAAQVVTCNTIPHDSNRIDVSDLLAEGIDVLLTS